MSLTIKQAFEALSDACANGMKNPFFVMRRLKESFADVASKVVDASGDKVTVTQTLTEGTEIGSIKVNNNTTTLYAPEGGGGNSDYSITEKVIGKWIDGTTDVYEVTINGNASSRKFTANLSSLNINKIVSMTASLDDGNYIEFPGYYSNTASDWSYVYYEKTAKKINLEYGTGLTIDGAVIIILRYIKNSNS